MKLSIVAAILSIVATLPQLYNTLATGLLRDHHPYTPILATLANALLMIHGYRTKDIGIFVIGAWFTFYNSVLVYFKLFRFDQEGIGK